MDVLINLFVNGISTGMLIFLLASGLSLIFGLIRNLSKINP
ncbi:branched-chain amino acid ABC transporter permease, partial [Bacillus sp. D-CC]